MAHKYDKSLFLYVSTHGYFPWMIVPPVRNWFGSVRPEVFTNRWIVFGTWFGTLLQSYLVRYVVRGRVRGIIPYQNLVPIQLFGLVRSSMVFPIASNKDD